MPCHNSSLLHRGQLGTFQSYSVSHSAPPPTKDHTRKMFRVLLAAPSACGLPNDAVWLACALRRAAHTQAGERGVIGTIGACVMRLRERLCVGTAASAQPCISAMPPLAYAVVGQQPARIGMQLHRQSSSPTGTRAGRRMIEQRSQRPGTSAGACRCGWQKRRTLVAV